MDVTSICLRAVFCALGLVGVAVPSWAQTPTVPPLEPSCPAQVAAGVLPSGWQTSNPAQTYCHDTRAAGTDPNQVSMAQEGSSTLFFFGGVWVSTDLTGLPIGGICTLTWSLYGPLAASSSAGLSVTVAQGQSLSSELNVVPETWTANSILFAAESSVATLTFTNNTLPNGTSESALHLDQIAITCQQEGAEKQNREQAITAAATDQARSASQGLLASQSYARGMLGVGSADDASSGVIVTNRGNDGHNHWLSLGVSEVQTSGSAPGSGRFAYALAGQDLHSNETQVFGVSLGAEIGNYRYQGSTNVDKVGVSVGVYGGQVRGEAAFTGAATITLFDNDFVTATGATGSASSVRTMASGSIAGLSHLPGGFALKGFHEISYTFERIEGFSYSDGARASSQTTDFGTITSGLELLSPVQDGVRRFFIRGQAEMVWGQDDVSLPSARGVRTSSSPSGEIAVGWVFGGASEVSGRLELAISGLGDADREEVRLEGTWQRQF